jgi:RNA polymerase sigma-70 factor (ECF subfamily)
MSVEQPPQQSMAADSTSVTSDAELMAAHVAGDTAAFGELVRRHRDRLWAVALRTTGDPEEAADALQDGLISAFRNAASFRGESAVTTWLHRVVVNASLDRLRRQKVRPTVSLPDESPDSGFRGIADPRDDIHDFELRHEIEKALAALPDDQRAAIVLVDVEGMSVAEAATILEIPEGTVKSRCSRGRTRLAASLAGLRNPEAVPHVTGAEREPTIDKRSTNETPPSTPSINVPSPSQQGEVPNER